MFFLKVGLLYGALSLENADHSGLLVTVVTCSLLNYCFWKVTLLAAFFSVLFLRGLVPLLIGIDGPLLGRNSIINITLAFLILIITLLFMIVFIITIIIFSQQRTVWKAVWAADQSLRADRWSSYASSAQEAQESLNEHHQILQIYSFLAKYITVFIFILK